MCRCGNVQVAHVQANVQMYKCGNVGMCKQQMCRGTNVQVAVESGQGKAGDIHTHSLHPAAASAWTFR